MNYNDRVPYNGPIYYNHRAPSGGSSLASLLPRGRFTRAEILERGRRILWERRDKERRIRALRLANLQKAREIQRINRELENPGEPAYEKWLREQKEIKLREIRLRSLKIARMVRQKGLETSSSAERMAYLDADRSEAEAREAEERKDASKLENEAIRNVGSQKPDALVWLVGQREIDIQAQRLRNLDKAREARKATLPPEPPPEPEAVRWERELRRMKSDETRDKNLGKAQAVLGKQREKDAEQKRLEDIRKGIREAEIAAQRLKNLEKARKAKRKK